MSDRLMMGPDELNAALRELGWSGVELGRRVGRGKPAISAYRTGRNKVDGPVAAYVHLALSIKRLGDCL